MGITIKEIARLAGVGISTVSRAINGSGSVSEATRKKIMDIIQEYHYIPNNSARNLKITQTKNIALLVKGIANPFFNKLIRVIEQEMTMRGYPLMITNVSDHSYELDIAIQERQDRNICGAIIMGGSYDYSEEKFRQLGIPCVLVTIAANKKVDRSLYSSVRVDDEKEGYRATSHLISLGHKRIGFMHHTPTETATPNALRYQGYIRALNEHGLPFDPKLVAVNHTTDDTGFKVGFQLMKQLYMSNKDMTAVFAFADSLAVGAAKAAFTMGISIPEDMSIIGFDGIEMTEYFHPSLDTMFQPATEMALSSVDILCDMLHGGKAQHIVYESVLLKRGSTRKAPQ